MNPAIAALIKMLGIDPAQLEQMVNGSQQILADFDNRLKLALAGIEELKQQQKADTQAILTCLEQIYGRSSSIRNTSANGSAGSLDTTADRTAADLAPGRSGSG